ncbi:MAG: endonuclease III [Myxococcales bacterium]
MRRDEKLRRIMETLDTLVPDPGVPLDHADPFTLLVAVVLSAQTTDKKVNQVTPALFALAPTPERMAALGVEQVRDVIREVGLAPQKAKALVGLAGRLVAEHGGQVPADQAALEALPGVGAKTAQVVMAQAFGVPSFPVDTHIHRLATRWGLTDGRSVQQTERDLKRLFPRESWNRLHIQIILFGRGWCPALWHDLAACPICSWAASKARIEEERRANDARRKR